MLNDLIWSHPMMSMPKMRIPCKASISLAAWGCHPDALENRARGTGLGGSFWTLRWQNGHALSLLRNLLTCCYCRWMPPWSFPHKSTCTAEILNPVICALQPSYIWMTFVQWCQTRNSMIWRPTHAIGWEQRLRVVLWWHWPRTAKFGSLTKYYGTKPFVVSILYFTM